MLPFILTTIALSALGFAGVILGLKLARTLREQFDEMMPQRMIDYSGFVNVEPSKD